MAASQFGSYGERYDLVVRRGATAGPLDAEMKNEDGSAYNLAGHEIRGWVCRRSNNERVVPITASITNEAGGAYRFEVTDEDTSKLVADGDPTRPETAYFWFLEMLRPDGRVIPLYWGNAPVWRG